MALGDRGEPLLESPGSVAGAITASEARGILKRRPRNRSSWRIYWHQGEKRRKQYFSVLWVSRRASSGKLA